MGVPEENVRVTPDDFYSMDPSYFRDTLVFNFPNSIARNLLFEDLDTIRRNNFLTVAAAGNTNTNDDRRDLWYPDHPWWITKGGPDMWENAFAAFATGRFILAKYAKIASDGTVVPLEGNVKCGLAKDSCYSIISSPENRSFGTSSASARLSALTFYLFQLWDTPREVVGVLNVCAEDVGDPGVDEEFGRGIVSVVCDTVQNRERRVVSSSMQVSNAASPVFAEMVGVAMSPESCRSPCSPDSRRNGSGLSTLSEGTPSGRPPDTREDGFPWGKPIFSSPAEPTTLPWGFAPRCCAFQGHLSRSSERGEICSPPADMPSLSSDPTGTAGGTACPSMRDIWESGTSAVSDPEPFPCMPVTGGCGNRRHPRPSPGQCRTCRFRGRQSRGPILFLSGAARFDRPHTSSDGGAVLLKATPGLDADQAPRNPFGGQPLPGGRRHPVPFRR